MGLLKQEMMGTANWPFSMYPGLSLGAMNTIFLHGTEDQKQTYLAPLTEGRWAGTMCLTEPQCGTDLGLIRTRANPNDDGSYAIEGTKIWITGGEHDLDAADFVDPGQSGAESVGLVVAEVHLPVAGADRGA